MNTNTILDIDSILDETLDQTPDLPDYINPPAGDYRLGMNDAKIEKYKTKNEKQQEIEALRIKLTYAVNSTLQVAKDTDLPVADGTLFTETFQVTEDGKAYFKKQAKKILNVENLDGVKLRDIIETLKDQKDFPARIKVRNSVKNGVTYENVNVIPMWAQEEAQEAEDAAA